MCTEAEQEDDVVVAPFLRDPFLEKKRSGTV
jgi:hypothetical protein